MKSMRLFRSAASSNRSTTNDAASTLSLDPFFRKRRRQVETENDKLCRRLDQAERTIEQLKPTARATTGNNTAATGSMIPVESSEHNDDSTVVSNATTVKASGTPKNKRNEKHPSTPTKEAKAVLELPPSTPATIDSDCTTSSSRRLLGFLKRGEKLVVWKRPEPKMSDAALELSDLAYVATTPARRKVGGRKLTQQELSLTMERYLYSDTTSSTNSCGTLAEF